MLSTSNHSIIIKLIQH